MDRTLIYNKRSLILTRGEDEENAILVGNDMDLDLEAFQKIAKSSYLLLLEELQGN